MDLKKINLVNLVRKDYGTVARNEPGIAIASSCCGNDPDSQENLLKTGRMLGYSEEELKVGLGESNLGLGCGNPQAMAELKEGETVLDLGSGAGFDAFLAGMAVGSQGKVIGVDMTPDMLTKARENAVNLKYENVTFRLGEIEHLPVADANVDIVISNCVINLSVDKQQVVNDSFRVLRPGGRVAFSDILRVGELPQEVLDNPSAYSG